MARETRFRTRALRRNRRPSLLASAAIPVLALGWLLLWLWRNPRLEWDSRHLARGAWKLADCAAAGQWSGCPDSQHFPLFQYLLAWAAGLLGFGLEETLLIFSRLSTLAFGSVFLLLFAHARRTSRAADAWFLSVALGGSPLLWYASSSFGEMGASALILGFLVSLAWGARGWVVATLGFLSTITKETAFPFLLIFGWVAGTATGESRERGQNGGFHAGAPGARVAAEVGARWNPRAVLGLRALPTLVGISTGIVCNLAFNWFRFGSPRNLTNLQAKFQVPDLANWASSFAAIWLSPTSGALAFWPAVVVLLVVSIGSALRKPARERWPSRYRTLAVAIALAGLTAGFATWYSPMGHIAWGPRLLLPWLLPAAFAAAWAAPRGLEPVAAWIAASPWRRVSVSLGLAAFAYPQLAILFDPTPMWAFFSPDPGCPQVAYIEMRDYYYACLRHGLWWKRSPLIDAWSLPGARGWLLPLGFLVAWSALVPPRNRAQGPHANSRFS